MKNNLLFGLPVVFLLTVVLTPAMAGNGPIDSQLDITSGIVFEGSSHVSAKINVVDPVTATGFKGTGILTGNSLAVTTTHGGVLDSMAQTNAADKIAHNHYVDLVLPSNNCQVTAEGNEVLIRQVSQISWESPGIAMWTENMYKIWEVPKVFEGHSALDLGTTPHTFTLGAVGANPQVVSFGIAVGAGGEVCILVKDVSDAILEDLVKVGGETIPIDTTSLLLAAASSTSGLMLVVTIAALGIGAYVFTRNPNNVRNIKVILQDYLNRFTKTD